MNPNITDRIWWILVDKEQLGPISYLELEKESRFTPDTYVWKEGMKEWLRARDVEELKTLFEDKVPKDLNDEENDEDLPSDDELTIDVRSQPPYFWIWGIIIIIILLYIWYLYS